jgi:hypothetical protein
MNRPGRCTDERFDLGLWHGFEDPFQNQEVRVFVLQGERKVVGEFIAGPVTLVEDGPCLLTAAAAAHMLVSDATRSSALRLND